MSKRTNKLYNYLVNTFGLSKETVLEHVETRLEDLVDKHVSSILQSNRIENMIMNRVSHYIKNGSIGYYGEKTAFNDVIKEQVKQVVEDQLKKNCEVKFQFLPNSIQFMKED